MEVARGGLILLLLTSVASSSSEVVVPVTYVGPLNATEVISELELSGQAGRPLTVHVEGIVGTGKSTMLKAFDNHHGTVDVLPEPVEQWTNLNGTDVLDLIFTDPWRWGATQASVQSSLASTLCRPGMSCTFPCNYQGFHFS